MCAWGGGEEAKEPKALGKTRARPKTAYFASCRCLAAPLSCTNARVRLGMVVKVCAGQSYISCPNPFTHPPLVCLPVEDLERGPIFACVLCGNRLRGVWLGGVKGSLGEPVG